MTFGSQIKLFKTNSPLKHRNEDMANNMLMRRFYLGHFESLAISNLKFIYYTYLAYWPSDCVGYDVDPTKFETKFTVI